MTKYLDPERTLGLGLLAVPDAVYETAPEAHGEGYREGVLVVPYSLALPYVLALYRLAVRFGGARGTRTAEALRLVDERCGRPARRWKAACRGPSSSSRTRATPCASTWRARSGRPRGCWTKRGSADNLTVLAPRQTMIFKTLAILVAAGRGERMGGSGRRPSWPWRGSPCSCARPAPSRPLLPSTPWWWSSPPPSWSGPRGAGANLQALGRGFRRAETAGLGAGRAGPGARRLRRHRARPRRRPPAGGRGADRVGGGRRHPDGRRDARAARGGHHQARRATAWSSHARPRRAGRRADAPGVPVRPPGARPTSRRERDGVALTDEAMAVERLGQPVARWPARRATARSPRRTTWPGRRPCSLARPRSDRPPRRHRLRRPPPGARPAAGAGRGDGAPRRGLDGHSDGDCLIHAVCDALLGAAGAGDMGGHFPSRDARWKDAPSGVFLAAVATAAGRARLRGRERGRDRDRPGAARWRRTRGHARVAGARAGRRSRPRVGEGQEHRRPGRHRPRRGHRRPGRRPAAYEWTRANGHEPDLRDQPRAGGAQRGHAALRPPAGGEGAAQPPRLGGDRRAGQLGIPCASRRARPSTAWRAACPHQGLIAVVSAKPRARPRDAAGRGARARAARGARRRGGPAQPGRHPAHAPRRRAPTACSLPERHSAGLSETVSRASAGALEHVQVARIGNVAQALEALKARGVWVVGFDASGTERWDAVDYRGPVALVLGGEGRGIRRLVRERCDHLVSLPLFGHVGSLNVSVAAGIALYEVIRQRGAVPSHVRPIPRERGGGPPGRGAGSRGRGARPGRRVYGAGAAWRERGARTTPLASGSRSSSSRTTEHVGLDRAPPCWPRTQAGPHARATAAAARSTDSPRRSPAAREPRRPGGAAAPPVRRQARGRRGEPRRRTKRRGPPAGPGRSRMRGSARRDRGRRLRSRPAGRRPKAGAAPAAGPAGGRRRRRRRRQAVRSHECFSSGTVACNALSALVQSGFVAGVAQR